MVADPVRPRTLALLLAITFILSAWVPLAGAQLPLGELGVARGSVVITSGGNQVNFLEPGQSGSINITVTNTGSASVPAGFPVYWYLSPAQKGCIIWDKTVPAANSDGPGRTSTSRSISASTEVPDGGNLIYIVVNDAPKTSWQLATCGTLANENPTGGSTPTRHFAWGYFVKNATLDLNATAIDWCRSVDGNCVTDMFDGTTGQYHNKTAYADKPASTYFRVHVANQGSWTDMKNLSAADCTRTATFEPNPSTCSNFHYDLQLRVTGPGITATSGELLITELESSSAADGGSQIWVSDAWSLIGRKGDYNVSAHVNPTGKNFPENKTLNNQRDIVVNVRSVDLRANITASDFRTTAANPYPFTAPSRVAGMVQFHNDGTANAINDASKYRSAAITISTFVDLDRKFLTTRDAQTINADGTISAWVDFNFTTDKEDTARYLGPGAHTLYAVIDEGGLWDETNESNNNVSIRFYVADARPPTFDNIADNTRITRGSDLTDVVYPGEWLTVRAYVDDDDRANLNVVASFTTDANASYVHNFTLTDNQGRFFRANMSALPWIAYEGQENLSSAKTNWTYRVTATDALGNTAVSNPRNITMERWPVHTTDENYTIIGQAQNRTIPWSGPDDPFYRIILLPNMTGVKDQWNVTSNINLYVDPPGEGADGRPYTVPGSIWRRIDGSCTFPSENSETTGNLTDDLGAGVGPGSDKIFECPTYGQRNVSFSKGDGRPGVWNVSLNITDLGGQTRIFLRNFVVIDELPVFRDVKVTPTVNAGSDIRIEANVSDDFDIDKTYANFTRSDGKWRNITLSVNDSRSDGGVSVKHYLTNLTTGRGQALGLAGTFNMTLVSVDINGNWNRSENLSVIISDADRPSITLAGAMPAEQEVGENVTFFAIATDQTNLTLRLTVSRGGEVVYEAEMSDVDGNNYTHVTNFSFQDSYKWQIIAYDGKTIPEASPEKTGTLAVRDNLGPRFELRSPSFVGPQGVRYGTSTPRIEVVVYDSDGVNAESINMTIDDIQVIPEISAAPTGLRGHTLSFQVPASQKYGHNDTVTINVTALDTSDKTLAGTATYTFRVDDTAPVSRMLSFEPRHRDLEGHVWNVSLTTEFKLEATDNDGLPTDVSAIRYQIIGGGGAAGAEGTYTGPFTIGSLPGAYTGPRVYLIQFYAEDQVGNRERPAQQVAVYVDDTAPVIDPFGSLPQGRYVNATFIDDRAGVDRAVVWHRINDAPYQPTTLEFDQGVWRAILQEGKKGDRVAYYLQAWDRVGNNDKIGNESAPYSSYVVGNHLPDLKITKPLLGARVNKVLDLTWTATDEDGDQLSYVIYLKAPGRQNFVELASIDVSERRSYPLDTTRYADGQYTLAITANDGSFVTRAETTVTFANSGSALGNVTGPAPRVSPNDKILLTAEVRKAQAQVEARVYRDGELVDAFAMNDRGEEGDLVANDGIYSVEVSFARAGAYSVEIVTLYQEGGESKEDKVNAASFTVKLTPGAIVAEYAAVWVALIALTLAAVGIAGFALYRKWR